MYIQRYISTPMTPLTVTLTSRHAQLFDTLRVVQVSVKDGVPKTPDPKWLQMWTVIEPSMGTLLH
jgi:hypothetical protein